ncbi:unnamed protein product [Pleuronectes platessa]|uniref:Uncharacterized protein n=1 Tax=Pleuronectes platessa TaxID=8262 RepID=A0A9N7YEM6_PLEPL|nr:unnamed protein product [Pleuronectes platessa]
MAAFTCRTFVASLLDNVPDRKMNLDEEEAKRIAEMGKPVLGEHSKLEVIIEESYEFKSTVDKLIKKTNLALVVGTNSWRDQFMEAITVSAGLLGPQLKFISTVPLSWK